MSTLNVFRIKDKVFLFGGINSRNSNTLVKFLEGVSGPRLKQLVISSGGGSVPDAIKICESIRMRPDFSVRVQGEACSAATFLLASASGCREMTKHSYLMYHLPHMQAEDNSKINVLTAYKHQEEFKFMEMIIKNILLKRNYGNKKALDFYREFTTNDKDFYLNAREALNLGFIDRIV